MLYQIQNPKCIKRGLSLLSFDLFKLSFCSYLCDISPTQTHIHITSLLHIINMNPLVSLLSNYQITSICVALLFCFAAGTAIKDYGTYERVVASFLDEITLWDAVHPLLGVFYAGVKIPYDRSVGSLWIFLQAFFVIIPFSCMLVMRYTNGIE